MPLLFVIVEDGFHLYFVFLFSKNRLNVAISRAQALAIVVGSPRLGRTPVSNLRQMELVNFYSEIVRYGSWG